LSFIPNLHVFSALSEIHGSIVGGCKADSLFAVKTKSSSRFPGGALPRIQLQLRK
jgi:hypothetical protein